MTALIESPTTVGVPGTEISSQWVEVTPEMATAWMKHNTDNRTMKRKHLERIERDMLGDKFVMTHQGVAICDDGTLIDGQHRLQAIIDTNKPQWMLVTTGLPMAAQKFVDNGAKRAASDMGPLKQAGYGAMKAAALRILLAIEEMDHRVSPTGFNATMSLFSYGELDAAYTQYEDDLERFLTPALAAAKVFTKRISAAQFLAASIYYPDRAEAFLKGLTDIVGMKQGDPRAALLRYQGPGRIQAPVSAFVSLKAARAFHYGNPLGVIKWRQGETMDLRKPGALSGHYRKNKAGELVEE